LSMREFYLDLSAGGRRKGKKKRRKRGEKQEPKHDQKRKKKKGEGKERIVLFFYFFGRKGGGKREKKGEGPDVLTRSSDREKRKHAISPYPTPSFTFFDPKWVVRIKEKRRGK